jgi:hypothetical protein
LVLLLVRPGEIRSTGFGEPDRWIDQECKTVLQAPDFYFEFEVKRLAAELKPQWKALPPKAGNEKEEASDYDDQTEAADLADYEAALQSGAIKPEDPAKARDAHEIARAFLQTPGANAVGEDDPAADLSKLPTPISSEFPSEFADYHRGAYWFRQKQYAEAAKSWEALLARPPAERTYRSVWAAFMLGRAAFYQQHWDGACTWFQKAREFAQQGQHDGIGLAASSLGLEAQAHLEVDRFSEAARLFLEQQAAGDVSAVYSLRDVVASMFMKNYDLKKAVSDPILQRVVTSCCVAGLGPFSNWAYYEFESDTKAREEDASVKWLRALEEAGARNVRDADRVAWIAYSQGNFAKAARWLQRSNQETPHALWLRAKLQLREGKIDAAAKLMARVIQELPDQELETRSYVEGEFAQPVSAKGDLAMLKFTRGDYVAALKYFVDGGHSQDAAYLAEAILTTKELAAFLDREGAGADSAAATVAKTDEPEAEETLDDTPRNEAAEQRGYLIESLRTTLGQRFVRSGDFSQARKYLNETDRETLAEYERLLNKANDKALPKAERVTAFQELARYTEDNCARLFEITDVEIQSARLAGRSVEKEEYPKQTLKFGDKLRPALPITTQERERLRRNSFRVLRHSLASHIAADHAWSASQLMPDNDEATAKWLNEAGSWLKLRDIPAADRFYQAIERRCAQTELGKEAIKRHWFVPIVQSEGAERN